MNYAGYLRSAEYTKIMRAAFPLSSQQLPMSKSAFLCVFSVFSVTVETAGVARGFQVEPAGNARL